MWNMMISIERALPMAKKENSKFVNFYEKALTIKNSSRANIYLKKSVSLDGNKNNMPDNV